MRKKDATCEVKGTKREDGKWAEGWRQPLRTPRADAKLLAARSRLCNLTVLLSVSALFQFRGDAQDESDSAATEAYEA
jgi:hypothetical protein